MMAAERCMPPQVLRVAAMALLFLLSACSAGPTPGIVKIRSLSAPVLVSEARDVSGEIAGLERTSTRPDGTLRANVLIVHGMGWAKLDLAHDRSGFDVIRAMQAMYGVTGTASHTARLCPQIAQDGTRDPQFLPGGLMIVAEPGDRAMRTDAPGTSLSIHDLACLDRIVIDLGARGTITVYRLFWDDTFYNAYSYAHLGYDDGIFRGHEESIAGHRGYEDISAQRESLNRRLKTELVTYGFSDATMYLGPAGERVRQAMRGALCAIVNESSGQASHFERLEARYAKEPHAPDFIGTRFTSSALCSADGVGQAAALTIITKSLGSRAVFDTLTRDMTPGLAGKLRQLPNQALEVFMMANQIPLLGLGRLQIDDGAATPGMDTGTRLRFIAVSEINDPLTFELVPYFEHLYFRRCTPGVLCDQDYVKQRMQAFRSDPDARRAYIQELGFEVIDVRARFAGTVVPLLGLVDPLEAHEAHLTIKPIQKLFLCGADRGILRQQGCSVR